MHHDSSTPLLTGRPRSKKVLRMSSSDKAAIAIGLLSALCIGSVLYVARTMAVPSTTTDGAGSSSTMMSKLPPLDFSGDLRVRCTESYFVQTLNHFEAIPDTYRQRYFVCDEFWHQNSSGPIFFYAGNEADVELYLNHTGLMWENAREFGAILVFAEHRYFGKSVPSDATSRLQHLSSEQALADYATLLGHIKATRSGASSSPVIAFGGSYGGMLASWFRIKYPHVVDGAIAASAPVLSFLGESPPANLTAFSQIVTYDASPAAGSVANCASNVRRVWDVLIDAAATEDGRAIVQRGLGLCNPLSGKDDALSVREWAKAAFDYLAMGNFPYPSSYIMNGASELPAFPVREACKPFAPTFPWTEAGNFSLLQALRASVGVYYNSTHDVPCYARAAPSNESQIDADLWDYLFCSELYQPQDQGIRDMFWVDVHDQAADAARCLAKWHVQLRPEWATTVYGGRKALRASSNIVFSNGNYDPWSGMGVLEDLNPSVVAIDVEGGAHHLDLMFSHPLDPPGVKRARKEELSHVAKWIRQAKKAAPLR
ncbi:hypothetical protein H310_09148 [Aphanomyces invadans]|uniref:Lysosomal Pro-X carboxypeptidase n=1 Tax=Aphanomyces invadans TaxID=157072 RepID=A0A024TWQ9_9STRA|nr:hypothetical protein H310_09148 [Aphanomyces invadans]ETV97797.1 hypothetical protein H310_09148 [Aphanomyces invadans]|eukprot:XP_008873358.1 hypothetical protein H310_09148 [Aphanomyces invadans]